MPVMSLVFVSKKACQHIFVLSDPGVPRTFVGDCRYEGIVDYCTIGKPHDQNKSVTLVVKTTIEKKTRAFNVVRLL